ncbi:MAG: hypothetical protein LBC12_06095 [Nitrososphaerota archaeon]|jgi:transposase-like protein|nr:hypothetical protein [Nitrososphaerota archaeon]
MVTKTMVKCHTVVAKVSKNGQQNRQTSLQLQQQTCTRKNFIETYTNKAYQPNIREQVLKMTVNGTEKRTTERIPGTSKDTVKKKKKKHKTGPGK